MKLAYVDVETTGLNPKKHTLWSLALILVEDGKELAPPQRWTCRPMEGTAVDPEALEVGGVTMAELEEMPAPAQIKAEVEALLAQHIAKYDPKDKAFFVGYNAQFDANFVRQWFLGLGDKYFGSWFWHPPIDVMAYAAVKLMRERAELPNFKLATVAKHVGLAVDEERTHDALYDIQLTRALLMKVHR